MSNLTIIIPTRNEAESLPRVLTDLSKSLKGFTYQVFIIDDGDDNTPQVVKQMHMKEITFTRRAVSVQNGLSGAVILGFTWAKEKDSAYVAVMDGDGQHPPEVIRKMLCKAIYEKKDLIVASRYISGGSSKGLDGLLRKLYSFLLRLFPQILFFNKIKDITDPLSGCFLVRTACLRPELLKPIGWKIGLEVLLTSDISKRGEVSYEFKERIGGKSKAGLKVGLDYFRQLVSLMLRSISEK